jgi:hypothetical protein
VFFFLLSVLWGGWVGHYLPQEVFAKFGYRLESAYYGKKNRIPGTMCAGRTCYQANLPANRRFQFFSQNMLNL